MPNIRYYYEGNLREIDLYAFFEKINLNPKKGENKQHTITSIIVECKKSKYPWVFFSSKPYGSGSIFCFSKYYSDFDFYFADLGAPNLQFQINKKLEKNHYKYTKGVPYCLSYLEAFRNPNAPSEIYKAIESVISFLKYKIELRKLRAEKKGFFTEFYYPVVVLQGCLFKAEIDEEDINVQKTDHIHLRVDYQDEIFFVDVVTKEYFESFFEIIEKDHYDFIKSITEINFSKDYQASLNKKDFFDLYCG